MAVKQENFKTFISRCLNIVQIQSKSLPGLTRKGHLQEKSRP